MSGTEENFCNLHSVKCAFDKVYSFLKETAFLWDLVIGRKSSSFYKGGMFNITN